MINEIFKPYILAIENKEKKAKIQLIGSILDNYKINKPHLVNGDTFDALYMLEIPCLIDILDSLIRDMYIDINSNIDRLNNNLKP